MKRQKNKKAKGSKDAKPEERKSNIDAVSYTGRRHGRIMSLVADDVPRSTGQRGGAKGEKRMIKREKRERKGDRKRRSLYSY